MRHLICGVSVLLALLILLSIHIAPLDKAPLVPSVTNGDLFFDFTNDESISDWQGFGADLTMNNTADCASDGRMLASGTLTLTSENKTLHVQTTGLQYTGNKDDTYAEIRVKADGFNGSKEGTVTIYPCKEDGSSYVEDSCLTANVSQAELTAGDYVTLRFTNATQFAKWQSLRAIHNIAIVFRYDGIKSTHSLSYDYIYIGSERQNHVMMDFAQDSPVNTASHWTIRSTAHSRHNTTGVSTKDGCLYGTTSLDDQTCGYSFVTAENQFLYTVKSGDIVKLRVKLSRNAAKGGSLQEMRIAMGVGGTGYWPGYKGTVLSIPQLQIDGLYHEYTVKIPNNSNIIGKPLRSFCYGFVGRGGYTLDFEIDYIYVGSEINFSAYTGRSTVVDAPTPAHDDVQTIDNSLISFRLFNYNYRINDNSPTVAVLESFFPFHDENTDDSAFRFYETSDSTVMPYLSRDGCPMLNNGVNLSCLFGGSDAVGVHSYTPANSLLSFDGETYSYDSTKHTVDYDTATDLFYVRSNAGDGFTPFSYGKEIDNWFGFTMEMNFVQTSKDAVLKLSCIDDAWVFIDGVLVLDLGGSKVCKTGSIRFKNGEIVAAAGDKSQKHSLLQRYQAAGRQAVTAWNGSTFAEGSVHTLKIFFLERSTKGTQCQLSFNLSPIASADRHEFIPVSSGAMLSINQKQSNDVMQLWDKQVSSSKYDDHSFRLNYDVQINGHSYRMGDTAKYNDNAPVTAFIELYDPDRNAIGTVDLVGANGVAVFSASITDSYAYLEIPITAEQPYYYVRVTSAGKQHITSPPIRLEKCSSHSPIVDAAVAPSCTDDGKTEGSHCSRCYAILVAQNSIPAVGHRETYINNGADHSLGCKACEYSVSETHSFTNAVCICGAVEVMVSILDEGIHIRHALNLASSIALNYAVAVSELRDYESFYLQCVLPEFEGNVQIGTHTVEIQPVLSGNYYYFPLTGLSAVRMNDTVQATVFMMKNGISYCSVVDHYSIADYAYAILNNAKAEDSLKILCADLLRYGSEAQFFKGYRTDAPVDAKMTAVHRTYLSDTSILQFHGTDALLGDARTPAVTWVGKALSLDSKVGIKLVFDAKGYDPEQLTVKLRYRDYLGTVRTILLTNPTVYNASAGYYAVTCYDLAAAELRTVITAAIYKGEQQISESLQYSAESYAAKTDGTALESLCKALFAYSDSAYSYFTK